MTRRRISRFARWLGWLGWLGAVLISFELLYVLVANLVIWSGVIQRVAKAQPGFIELDWERAYSPWPGAVYVSGFRMSLEDAVMQLHLAFDSAKADIVLWELLLKRFRASHAQAEGACFRLVVKVESAAGIERRMAAFPPIAGFDRPALRANPMRPFPTSEQLDALWSVQFDDVDASLSELWILEFHYRGAGRLRGGFGLVPLRKLWVTRSLAEFDGGEMRVGDHLIATGFSSRTEVTIAQVDLRATRGLALLGALTGSVRFNTSLDDLSFLEVYVDGLDVHGGGRLTADLRVARGRLLAGSVLGASLSNVEAQLLGARITGDAHARLAFDAAPTLLLEASGAVSAPLEGEKIVIELSNVRGELVAASDELSRLPQFERLSAVLGEARVQDARAITWAISRQGPFFAPFVLGAGPLVASGTAHITPDYSLVRLRRMTMGTAQLEGAVVSGQQGWRGAASGHFGAIPIGLRMHEGKVETAAFVPDTWLEAELRKAGIEPHHPVRSE